MSLRLASHPLPVAWDGREVKWSRWDSTDRIIICPPPKSRCECGSDRAPFVAVGLRAADAGPGRFQRRYALRDLAAQEWASETRRGRRTTFGRFYAWGMFRGFVYVNPVDDTPRVRTVNGAARPTPDAAYREAIMAADPRAQLMLRLAAEVGMRRGEVAQVHTRDLMVDLVDFSLIVHGKGGKTRIVPLPRSLGKQIATEPVGYLFPGRDNGHLSPRYVGKIIRDLLPGEWTMHTLRHRFGTRAYALTSDLLLVQDLLGHASPSTTRRYVAGNPARARAAVEALAAQDEEMPMLTRRAIGQ